MQIDISLCGSNYDTVLYVYEGSCGTLKVCNDDACGTQSKLDSVSLIAGVSYYILVDGFNGACGDYTFTVTKNQRPRRVL
jgi:hypothetical protein